MVDAKNSSKLLTDWIKLSNEAASQEKNIPAERHKQLCDLCSSLFELLDTNQSSQFINDVCQQLIVLFRSKKRQLCLLVLEFVPSLVWSYASSRSKSLSCLEACLLTLYNLNLNFKQSTEGELPCVTIPCLGRSSVYHEPENLSCTTLTETALSRYDQGDRKIPLGPFPQVEKLNAKTRLPVLTHLLRCYNSDIGLFSASSHIQMCHLAIKLSCTGFKTYLSTKLLPQSKTAQTSLVNRPRIVVSPELLCELVHGVYFIMFNGKPELGFEALETVHQRANYELFSNVLLLTNSIKNSLEHNPSGQPYDGPMGVTISITPAHILTSLNKQAITNASFKTQKLPDDITPADGEGDPASDQEGDHKSPTAISAVDKQSKLLKPLKTAFKRVERSITQKKESRDNTPSPAKTDKSDKSDKVDGHNKISRQPSGGKDKEKPSNQHEMTSMNSSPLPAASHVSASAQTGSPAALPEISQEKLEFVDTFENGVDGSFHTLDIDKIEIIIEPPDEDSITTKM